jgi:hypothetical protein
VLCKLYATLVILIFKSGAIIKRGSNISFGLNTCFRHCNLCQAIILQRAISNYALYSFSVSSPGSSLGLPGFGAFHFKRDRSVISKTFSQSSDFTRMFYFVWNLQGRFSSDIFLCFHLVCSNLLAALTSRQWPPLPAAPTSLNSFPFRFLLEAL